MDSRQSIGPPERHHPAHLPPRDFSNRSIILFLTVCTKNRQPLLASSRMHELIREAWLQASHWTVGRYVVMPDHIHLFCAPGTFPPCGIGNWVAYWKRLVAFTRGGSIWQKNFWDTQLRQQESYTAKWEYVRNNPVRAGLAAHPDDWPYQGEIASLRWHD
jgi:putative transposase